MRGPEVSGSLKSKRTANALTVRAYDRRCSSKCREADECRSLNQSSDVESGGWRKVLLAEKLPRRLKATNESKVLTAALKCCATLKPLLRGCDSDRFAGSVVRKLFPRGRLESSLLISREGLDTIQELAQDASKLFRLLPGGIVSSFGDDSHLAAWNVLAH